MTKEINVLTDEEVSKLLAESPAERVTDEYMKSRIKVHDFERLHGTTTICRITLDNGYSVHGISACVNPKNYDQKVGEKIAYDNAYRQLWPLFGFLLAERNFLNASAPAEEGEAA